MGLTNAYVLPTNRIADLFQKIRDGQAPDQVSQQLLKDWGFTSSKDRAFIPLLKALGFLTPDGKPSQRYHNYRDHSRSKEVMAEALKEGYGDIFLIKAHPTGSDEASIKGKFKSFHNASDTTAHQMTKTFMALLRLADLSTVGKGSKHEGKPDDKASADDGRKERIPPGPSLLTGLHYNIQIHLPATKDIEVYNSIFKSLKEHLLAE